MIHITPYPSQKTARLFKSLITEQTSLIISRYWTHGPSKHSPTKRHKIPQNKNTSRIYELYQPYELNIGTKMNGKDNQRYAGTSYYFQAMTENSLYYVRSTPAWNSQTPVGRVLTLCLTEDDQKGGYVEPLRNTHTLFLHSNCET